MNTAPLHEIPPSLRLELARGQQLERMRAEYRQQQERLRWARPDPFAGIELAYISDAAWQAARAR